MPSTASGDRLQLLLTVLIAIFLGGARPGSAAESTTTIRGGLLIGEGALISTFPALAGGDEFSLRLSSGLKISAGPLRYPDGSSQFASQASQSTGTLIPTQSFSSTTFSACLGGSTITLTTNYLQHVAIRFSGTMTASVDAIVALDVLLDGATLPDYSGAAVVGHELREAKNLSFFIVAPTKVAAGSHSLCLRAKTSTGNVEIQQGPSYMNAFGAFAIR